MQINTFVNAVYLYGDKMVITFNYKDDTATIPFDEVNTALSNQETDSGLDLALHHLVARSALRLRLLYS